LCQTCNSSATITALHIAPWKTLLQSFGTKLYRYVCLWIRYHGPLCVPSYRFAITTSSYEMLPFANNESLQCCTCLHCVFSFLVIFWFLHFKFFKLTPDTCMSSNGNAAQFLLVIWEALSPLSWQLFLHAVQTSRILKPSSIWICLNATFLNCKSSAQLQQSPSL